MIAAGLCLAWAAPVAGAVVYKWTDADGVVHFSDQPVPGAEKIQTGSSPGRSSPTVAAPAPRVASAAPKKPAAGLDYALFAIASPAAEQTFFDAPVPVRLDLEPGLKENHTLVWLLNGKPLDNPEPNAVQFVIPDLPRGTYQLTALITDQTSQESTSNAVTFYMHQPSVFMPQHKTP
jgi:hypothetical protein